MPCHWMPFDSTPVSPPSVRNYSLSFSSLNFPGVKEARIAEASDSGSEHIFNILGDTREACVHLSMRYTESLRFREAGERAEGLLELLEVVSIGFWCQEHVLRFRGKSSPRRLPRVFRYDRTLTTSHTPRDSFSRFSCKKKKRREREKESVLRAKNNGAAKGNYCILKGMTDDALYKKKEDGENK